MFLVVHELVYAFVCFLLTWTTHFCGRHFASCCSYTWPLNPRNFKQTGWWCRLSRWLNGRASAVFAGVPGSIPGWGVCDFFRFCQSFTSNSPFPFSFLFLFLSLSLSLRPFVCAKKRIFAFILLTILSVRAWCTMATVTGSPSEAG